MNMRLISSVADLQIYAREVRSRGKSLALVPTMGALHEGHQSLIRKAKQQCDTVLVSIFVNPMQFDAKTDFASYPRDIEKDEDTLRLLNVDAIFAPQQEALYPAGFDTFVNPGKLASVLEGTSRPGHFRGVATIILKLFNLVQPDVAYFGQKDFQQVQIIRRLVEDLNISVRLVIAPIIREADGLAMSSRNALLSGEERKAATVLYRSLQCGEALVHAGEVKAPILLEAMRKAVDSEPLVKLDYLALVNPSQLKPVERVTTGTVALITARVGSVRLIDNLIFGPPGSSPDLLLQMAFSARPVMDHRARIPGMETEALCRRIESCRDCAAISTVRIPPHEFLAKYLRLHYPDLNRVRVVVIGRDAPMDPEHYLYKHPERPTPFATALFELLGVKDFQDFKRECVLTDATRCHIVSEHVPEKALAYCARHLVEELKHFPNLQTIVTLGEDTYQQFQRDVLGRSTREIKPYKKMMKPAGWACEDVHLPFGDERPVHVVYYHHPMIGYERSQSVPREILLPPDSSG
jgi:pantoate--beta-alanine ligase